MFETNETIAAVEADETHAQVTVDTHALLSKMSFAFSTKTTLIAELMQNARRAGATKLEIKYVEEMGGLFIHDDGEGITSFNKLLKMFASGWKDQIQAEETPYGMGFFSALYAAEKVEVSSRGKTISFVTNEALSGKKIAIQDTGLQINGGTNIKLMGLMNRPGFRGGCFV